MIWKAVFVAALTWPWWADRLWRHTLAVQREIDAETAGPSWTPPWRPHAGVLLPPDYEGFRENGDVSW